MKYKKSFQIKCPVSISITAVLVLALVSSFLQLVCYMLSNKWKPSKQLSCWLSQLRQEAVALLREEEPPSPPTFKSIRSPRNPHSRPCDSSFLRWPWQGYFPFVRDFSRSSMQRWRMGSGAGNHSIHTLLFCFFCTVSFEAKENAGFTHYLHFKWAI